MPRKPTPKVVWTSADGHSRMVRGDHLALIGGVADNSVDCIWTDPPYFLSNGGTTCIAGKRATVDKGEWDKSGGVVSDHEFNRAWLGQCYRVLKPNGTIWVSGTHHVYLSVGMAMMELGFRLLNDIVWEKPNPPPNLGCRCFTHATEMVLWATKARKGGRDRHTFNYDDMKALNAGRQMKNVWQFKAPGQNEKQYGKHPTQKPLALIERCLQASTQPGDRVVDPFAGSGSTGVAALKQDCLFEGFEIDAKFARIAARRLREIDTSG